MAQLPDANVMALPQPGSRRPVSSIDVSGYARGTAAIGTGVEALGKGITSAVNDVAAVLKAQREYARANATLNAAAIKRGNEIERETNSAGLPEKVQTLLDEDAEIAAQQIKDPRARELLVLAAHNQRARLAGLAAARASHLAREDSKAEDVATLNALTEGAVQSSDPSAVQLAMQSASDVMDGWTWMDPGEADTAKALFAQDFAVRKFDALPLAERHAAFGSGRYAEVVAAMPAETRDQKRMATRREFAQTRDKASYDAFDAIRRTLDDAASGLVPLPAWEGIASNPNLQPADRDRARALHDTAAAEAASIGRFMTRLWDLDAGPFDPANPEDRKNADKAFALLGGDVLALQTVVPRTRILPARAAMQLHGSMMSDDPKRVMEALTISANLYTANPNIFIGSDGQSEFENNAVAFRHYVDALGMSADEAARRIIRDRSPEHQTRVQAQLKAEDVDGKIRRRLSVGDLAGEFAEVSWTEPFDPKVGFDPATHKELFEHYTEVVKDRYRETGDFALAKVQAADQLKRIWGVTRVSGSQTVMPYPPERAPAYDGIDDAADHIAAHAVDVIKAGTGEEVDRSRIMLRPIPGVTATQYKSGRTPSYLLMWFNKRGDLQMLPGGKAFEAPPSDVRAAGASHREAEARRAVYAAERGLGLTTSSEFGRELQGGFPDIPGSEWPSQRPGGSQPPIPAADKPQEQFWRQGRGGNSFRGAVSLAPDFSPRSSANRK